MRGALVKNLFDKKYLNAFLCKAIAELMEEDV